jgi:hypothetical protein
MPQVPEPKVPRFIYGSNPLKYTPDVTEPGEDQLIRPIYGAYYLRFGVGLVATGVPEK